MNLASSYSITYDLNGGSAVGNPTSYTEETATFSLNIPTKTGYTFTGWTGSNGSTPQISVSIQKGTIGNLTYTANWEVNPGTYTITYILNGGTVSGNPTTYTIDTDTFILNNPTRIGYTFVGWTGANGNTPQISVSVAKGMTGDLTYTANWQAAAQTYNITYNLDGGSVLGNPTNYSADMNGFTLNAPTKTGYTFIGWTGSNGSIPQIIVNVSKGTTGNLSYTANWMLNSNSSNETEPDDIDTEDDDDENNQLIDEIEAKTGKITKKTSTRSSITMNFKKVKISGKTVKYQVAIKTPKAKKWSKNYISGTKKTFKNLKKGQTYWISVRPYMTIDGEKYFGDWAKTKIVKTKK